MCFLKGKKIVGLFSLPVLIGVLVAAPPSAHSETYKSDTDFNQGILVNVNHDTPNNRMLKSDFLSFCDTKFMGVVR